MEKASKPKLVLIQGGCGIQGPIDRLGLRDRYPGASSKLVWVLVSAKLVLLTALAYVIFS